jgi:hypothetical protein
MTDDLTAVVAVSASTPTMLTALIGSDRSGPEKRDARVVQNCA